MTFPSKPILRKSNLKTFRKLARKHKALLLETLQKRELMAADLNLPTFSYQANPSVQGTPSSVVSTAAVSSAKFGDVSSTTSFRGVMLSLNRDSTSSEIEDQVNRFVSLNVNLARWQIHLASSQNLLQDLDRELQKIDQFLDKSQGRIQLVIDLHNPPGGVVEMQKVHNGVTYKAAHHKLFVDQAIADQVVTIWKTIVQRYAQSNQTSRWNSIAGFDLLNEPRTKILNADNQPPTITDLQTRDGKWSALVTRLINTIKTEQKKLSPKPIIIEPPDGNPELFSMIRRDAVNWAKAYPKLVFSPHIYSPQDYTGQYVDKITSDDPVNPIQRPDVYNPIAYTQPQKEAFQRSVQAIKTFQTNLANDLKQLKLATPRIYIGEFSVAQWAPGAASYMADAINAFETNGWDWTYHAYRESFVWDADPATRGTSAGGKSDRWALLQGYWNRNANPSAAASFVNVKGTSGNDQIVIRDLSGRPTHYEVVRRVGNTWVRQASGRWQDLGVLSVDGGNGNDRITVRSKGYIDAARAHDISIVLLGGEGNDILTGGLGDDVIDGGAGRDRILGGFGNDVLIGGAGIDVILGGEGDDFLFSGNSNSENAASEQLDAGVGVYQYINGKGVGNAPVTNPAILGQDDLSVGSIFTISPSVASDQMLDISGTDIRLVGKAGSASLSSQFIVREGLLQPDMASFESIGSPGSFLSLQNDKLVLLPFSNTEPYKTNASFYVGQTLDGKDGITISAAESSSKYLVFRNGQFVFAEDDLSDQFISESRLLFENLQAEVAPSAPSGLSAVASGASAIELTWTDNSNNETSFVIEQSEDRGQTWREIRQLGKDSTQTEIGGLNANVTYQFRVYAKGVSLKSSYSNVAEAQIEAKPQPPTQLSVHSIGSRSASVRWQDSSGNATAYELQLSQDGGQSWTTRPSGELNGTMADLNGLSRNTRYLVRVRAFNAGGASEYSMNLEFTTLNEVPVAPRNLSVANTFSRIVDLNWQDVADNETGYRIAISRDGGASWDNVGEVAANSVSYRVQNLQPGTSYWFKVRAVGDAGYSEYSNIASTTTRMEIPRDPTGLNAPTIGRNAVTLNWNDNSDVESEFRIAISRDGGRTWDNVGTVGANQRQFEVRGLSANTRYLFKVRAANAAGYSDYSNTVDLRTRR